MTALLILTLLSQWGWWGPGIDADFLQGKDTTAMFNAKTLQGKDTTGLWKHAGKDSAGTGDYDSLTFVKGGGRTCVVTGANAWAGGLSDTASGAQSVVAGGRGNIASGDSSFVGGGTRNKATGVFSNIIGGYGNLCTSKTGYIGGGYGNTCGAGDASTIAGGYINKATGATTVVVGGADNTASGAYAVVNGGVTNTASGDLSFVGGGKVNVARGAYSIIPGGIANLDSAAYSFALGCSARVRAADSSAGAIGFGRSVVTQGKRMVVIGGQFTTVGFWDDDSLVTQPGVDLIVHGPAKVDSAFTLTGIKVDSFRVAADTSTFTIWIGPHSFTIPED